MNSVLLGVIVIGIFVIILSVVVAFVIKAAKKKQKNEADELISGVETLKKGAAGERTIDGLNFKYKHFRGTDKAPPYFSMTVNCPTNGAFTIRKETKFDRFFKRMGVCIEIETHDNEFDDTYFISTAKIPFTRFFLERRENRDSIKALFALGFNYLKYDGKKMVVTWRNYPRRKKVEVSLIDQAAPHLAVLNQNLQKMPAQQWEEPTTWKIKRAATFAVTAIVLLGGIAALIVGMSNYKPLDGGKVFVNSLMFSLPLFVLFSWVALSLLRGRSTSHWELLVVFLISLFAFPLAGFGCNTLLNGALDDGPVSIHTMPVLRTYYSKSKNNYSYYAVVESWREGESSEKLKVSKRYYNNLRAGKSMISVTTKPGKYGFEWLVGFE